MTAVPAVRPEAMLRPAALRPAVPLQVQLTALAQIKAPILTLQARAPLQPVTGLLLMQARQARLGSTPLWAAAAPLMGLMPHQLMPVRVGLVVITLMFILVVPAMTTVWAVPAMAALWAVPARAAMHRIRLVELRALPLPQLMLMTAYALWVIRPSG